VEPLVDSFGRVTDYLRLSVTDRCNLRCRYCMPAEGLSWVPREQVLTYEEMIRFVRIAITLGVSRVRVTGGEPLLRRDLPALIEQIARLPGLEDLSLTTNAILLSQQAQELYRAGLRRINISLDSLRPEVFAKIARRNLLDRVMAGIESAAAAGFRPIKLNMVVVRGLNDDELEAFALLTRRTPFHVRFLEYMPLDGYGNWDRNKIVAGDEILRRLQKLGRLDPIPPKDPSDVALRFRFAQAQGEIGLILPVTRPFCASCSRIRLTAEGAIKNCLFGQQEWNIRDLLRSAASDEHIRAAIRLAVSRKKASFGGLDLDNERSARSMSQIGG
jgi:cyclic pyranopterin phosphate synthase